MPFYFNSFDIENSKQNRSDVTEAEKIYLTTRVEPTEKGGKVPFVPATGQNSTFDTIVSGTAVSGMFPYVGNRASDIGLQAVNVHNNQAVILIMFLKDNSTDYSHYFIYHATGDDQTDSAILANSLPTIQAKAHIVIMVPNSEPGIIDKYFGLITAQRHDLAKASTILWLAAWADFAVVLKGVAPVGSFGHTKQINQAPEIFSEETILPTLQCHKYVSDGIETSMHEKRDDVTPTQKIYPIAGEILKGENTGIPFAGTTDELKTNTFASVPAGEPILGVLPFIGDHAGLCATNVQASEAVILILFHDDNKNYTHCFFYHAKENDDYSSFSALHVNNLTSLHNAHIVIMVNNEKPEAIFEKHLRFLTQLNTGKGPEIPVLLWQAAWNDFAIVLKVKDPHKTQIGAFGHLLQPKNQPLADPKTYGFSKKFTRPKENDLDLRPFMFSSWDIENSKNKPSDIKVTDKIYPAGGVPIPHQEGKIPFVSKPDAGFTFVEMGTPLVRLLPFQEDDGLCAVNVQGDEALILILFYDDAKTYTHCFFYHATGNDNTDFERCTITLRANALLTFDKAHIIIMVNNPKPTTIFNKYIQLLTSQNWGATPESVFEWQAAWGDFAVILKDIKDKDHNSLMGSFGHFMHQEKPSLIDYDAYRFSEIYTESEIAANKEILTMTIDRNERPIEGGYPVYLSDLGFVSKLNQTLTQLHKIALNETLIPRGAIFNFRTYYSVEERFFRQRFDSYRQGSFNILNTRIGAVAHGKPWVFRAGANQNLKVESENMKLIQPNHPAAGNWLDITAEKGKNAVSDFMPVNLNSFITPGEGTSCLPILVCSFLKKGNVYTHCNFSWISFVQPAGNAPLQIKSTFPLKSVTEKVIKTPETYELEILMICNEASEQHLDTATAIIHSKFWKLLNGVFLQPKLMRWVVDCDQFVFSITDKVTFGCNFEFWRNSIVAKNHSTLEKAPVIYDSGNKNVQIYGDILVERRILTTYSNIAQPDRPQEIRLKCAGKSPFWGIAARMRTYATITALENNKGNTGTEVHLNDKAGASFKEDQLLFANLTAESILIVVVQPSRSKYNPHYGNTEVVFEKIFIYHTTKDMMFKNSSTSDELIGAITLPEISSMLVIKYNPRANEHSPDREDEKLLELVCMVFNKALSPRGEIVPDRITICITEQPNVCFALRCTRPENGERITVGIFGTFGDTITGQLEADRMASAASARANRK